MVNKLKDLSNPLQIICKYWRKDSLYKCSIACI